MGKTKSRRFKYHLAAQKRDVHQDHGCNDIPIQPGSQLPSLPLPIPSFNPFAGLKIDPQQLNIPPPEEWDRKTVVSIHKEVTKGRNKKEKAKMRKELILKKLEATRELELKLREKRRREKTTITKDLKPLLDALPTVNLLHHEASVKTKQAQVDQAKQKKNKSKDRNSMKAGRKQKEILKDIETFKKILENEHFKANPTETMLNHVTYYVQKEYKDDSRSQK